MNAATEKINCLWGFDMNFFKLYIGDYQRDTGTLTLAEHGAYMLMLQQFYANEMPLPTGRELYRLLRADSKQEREAIDRIALLFWRQTPEGLTNDRATEEIAKASAQRETNREIAKTREAKRKVERKQHDSCSVRVTNESPNQTPDVNPAIKDNEGGGGRVAGVASPVLVGGRWYESAEVANG